MLTSKETDCINDCRDYVRNLMKEDCSGHDWLHMDRVDKLAIKIAERNLGSINQFDLELTALLHDVDDRKLFPETADTYQNARDFMAKYPDLIDDKKCEKIISDISHISFSKGLTPDSIEGKIVQDADRLDAIGAIGIARAFAFGGSHNSPIYDPEIKPGSKGAVTTTINHFYEKLLNLKGSLNTAAGNLIAKERTDFMKLYLDKFYEDVGISNSPTPAYDKLKTIVSKSNINTPETDTSYTKA